MKLLCWMHRKFRQNTNEALKALVIGQSSIDDQQYFTKPNYGNTTRPLKQVQRDNYNNNNNLRKSFNGLEDQEDYEDHEESSDAISDLFHGFLAIGTLGSNDQINITDHPATPTFSISVENITEKETEVTENELKLINDELEKVLSAEAPDDGFNEYSSGRNSHVSNGRSSHGSIITLSGKADQDGNTTAVCPLQGYLFGSAIELSETTTTVVQAKKEHRTSLGELFQRSKVVEESNGGGGKNDKDMIHQEKMMRSEKEGDKSAMNMMKKKLKKKMLHASSRTGGTTTTAGGGGPGDPAPTETKLHKILHMFHRKVHPETSATVLKSSKRQKNEQKKKTTHEYGGAGNNGGQVHPDHEDIILCPQRALFLKQKIRRYRSQSNPPQFTFGSIDSNGNREQWIKTDADYLVLEL
ncbi:protein LAZY 1 [Morus notabilis]|uniref:protein LAZY 1 n=1 Tax=Morus notabilis TaxID=981085 RepID=UPI000CED7274|nr:protein LAZY 1 [Morus notabilis]